MRDPILIDGWVHYRDFRKEVPLEEDSGCGLLCHEKCPFCGGRAHGQAVYGGIVWYCNECDRIF